MTVLKYILLFFFYSAAGWALESLYRSIGEGKIINSGFLTGPMCPIYGCGALVMTLFLYNPFYDRPLIVFLLGMVLCDAVEYFTSLIMELLFNQHWWNYQYEFINIRGRICLKHTLFWGAGSVGFTYVIHPFVDKTVSGFPDKAIIIIVCCSIAIFIVDWVHAFFKALDVRKMQAKFYAFREKVTHPIEGIIDKVGDATSTIGDKLNESNSKISESQEELFEQVESLIKSFEEKLGISYADKKERFRNRFRYRMYENAKIHLNSLRELEWLKKIKEEIKGKDSNGN